MNPIKRTKKRLIIGTRNKNHWSIFWRVTACPSWEKIKHGSKSEKTNWEPDTNTLVESQRERETQKIKEERNFTPFKSLRPEGGKMLTYLEAMRRPKKHMVNTLAIGITAILIVPRTESPAAATAGLSMKSARILAIILLAEKKTLEFSAKEAKGRDFLLTGWLWAMNLREIWRRKTKTAKQKWIVSVLITRERESFLDISISPEILALSFSLFLWLPRAFTYLLLSLSKPKRPDSINCLFPSFFVSRVLLKFPSFFFLLNCQVSKLKEEKNILSAKLIRLQPVSLTKSTRRLICLWYG